MPPTTLASIFCGENRGKLMIPLGQGEGGIPLGYRPGASLTKQTGRIADTVSEGVSELKANHAMESEQCDGREATVCVGLRTG